MRTAIGVVAKAPLPGVAKTRLCPPLTPEQAAMVARALLFDTVRAARASGFDPWCSYLGPRAAFAGLVPPGVPLVAQIGDSFGERLATVQRDLFAHGYDRVVLLGADCPTVTVADLRQAVTALDTADVVLGPARDGGYTLLGARAPCSALFTGVTLETDTVFDATWRAAEAWGLSVGFLPARHDIDTFDDLCDAAAAGELAAAPATSAALYWTGERRPMRSRAASAVLPDIEG